MSPPGPPDRQADGETTATRLAGILDEDPSATPPVDQLARSLGLVVLEPAHPAALAARARSGSPGDGRSTADGGPTAILVRSTAGLELRCPMGTVRVDFLTGREALRVRRGSGRREPLARALGLAASQPTASVLDATAGLGRDTFLLACLGVDVLAVERDPVIGALLRDALERGASGGGPMDPLSRITLRIDEASSVLDSLAASETPDAVYIDPMFPPRRKSSLVKKEMRIVAEMVGGTTPTDDVRALLHAALGVARRRVVVKRPADAQPVRDASRPPDLTTPGGRTTCYDVWLC